MFHGEFNICCWRPVFDSDGHMLDVFSKKELLPLGGGDALAKALANRELYAAPITAPKAITDTLKTSDVVVVLHSEAESVAVHEAYERLGLKRQPILIPK